MMRVCVSLHYSMSGSDSGLQPIGEEIPFVLLIHQEFGDCRKFIYFDLND